MHFPMSYTLGTGSNNRKVLIVQRVAESLSISWEGDSCIGLGIINSSVLHHAHNRLMRLFKDHQSYIMFTILKSLFQGDSSL